MQNIENYYKQIKDRIINTEVTVRVKDYAKNKVMLENYYEIGRLIVEAQGGEKRAKYGNKLIKEYSLRLTNELGKKYGERNLRNMRQFYILFEDEIWHSMNAELDWSHYKELLVLTDFQEIKYYINISINQNLTYRQLHERIKSKEYERLDKQTKLKLIEDKELSLIDTVKEPIIISNPNNIEIVREKMLQKLILEDITNFMEELGDGYSFIKSEYPIKIGSRYYYIDLLLYNIEFESYVVIELKLGELKKESIGQIEIYMNYIDKNIKKISQNKTVGIILCQKNNRLIMEYCSDPRIIAREYVLN